MPQESVAEVRHISSCLWVDCAHVSDILHISPGMGVFVVESTVINVFSDQLGSRLVAKLINLYKLTEKMQNFAAFDPSPISR